MSKNTESVKSPKVITQKELLEKELANPEFKKEYDALEPEFQERRANIIANLKSGGQFGNSPPKNKHRKRRGIRNGRALQHTETVVKSEPPFVSKEEVPAPFVTHNKDVKKAIQGAPFRNPPKEKTIMVVRCPKCRHLVAESLIEEHKKTCKGQEQHSDPSGAQHLTGLLRKAQREG